MNRGGTRNRKKKQIRVQIGQYSNRRDVFGEKKYKIKEIKRCLREKRISKVSREGEEGGKREKRYDPR